MQGKRHLHIEVVVLFFVRLLLAGAAANVSSILSTTIPSIISKLGRCLNHHLNDKSVANARRKDMIVATVLSFV
jgi:hypothetical protein